MGFDGNRGSIILKNWDKRQKELDAIADLQGNLKMDIKMQKYVFLRDGLARLSKDPTADERIYAGIIKAILGKLRKDLFPNSILRAFMDWKERLLIMPGLTRYFWQKRMQNFEPLDKRVSSMGITGLSEHLRSQLDYEREKIELPISSRFEQNGALELTLFFEQRSGEYLLAKMDATLLQTGEFGRKCSIPDEYGLHVNHAICLLKGGAVKLEGVQVGAGEKWLQLDFERRDELGRFPLRELILDDSFTLDKMLNNAATELSYPALNQQEVLQIIKTGAQAVFKPEGMDAFYIEANPREKTILFRDENKQVIPFYQMKETFAKRLPSANDQHPNVKKLEVVKSKGKDFGLEI